MLRFHFLNVGDGDSTIIEHPSGRLTMVDINDSGEYDSGSMHDYIQERSRGDTKVRPILQALISANLYRTDAATELTDPVEFLKSTYPARRLWRFILTHPDLDHMRGLARLGREVGFNNFWDTEHTKTVPSLRSDADKADWAFYQAIRRNEKGNIRKVYHRGDAAYAFAKDENGMPGGDSIQILSPTRALVTSCNARTVSNEHHHRRGSRGVSHPGNSSRFRSTKRVGGEAEKGLSILPLNSITAENPMEYR
jgi:competence protein ComEC